MAVARPPFAHESEAELARILDFYGVRWEYEPHTFPILWNLDGDVLESFSPDFYLPDLELYVELTTLKQKLVRKKNRKLRRLRELYPDIRIKLFYARDFRQLMLKYGKLELVDEISGTTGQVAAPHARVDDDVASDGAATAAQRAPETEQAQPDDAAAGELAHADAAVGPAERLPGRTARRARRPRHAARRSAETAAGAMMVAGDGPSGEGAGRRRGSND